MALLVPGRSLSTVDLENAVQNYLDSQGDIFAFQSLGMMDQSVWKAGVEFADVDVAVTVASELNGVYFDNVSLP